VVTWKFQQFCSAAIIDKQTPSSTERMMRNSITAYKTNLEEKEKSVFFFCRRRQQR